MLFRVPGFGGSPDPLTIFVSHSVVPIQQVFHRQNQEIWTMLSDFFRGLFTELNVVVFDQ